MTTIIIFIAWICEPCMSRFAARWKQPPQCVLEVGNTKTFYSGLLKRLVSARKEPNQSLHLVLPNRLKEHLLDLEFTTIEAIANKSPLPPVIFHGPDAAGKFSVAKYLSQSLAIPYAFVSGTAIASASVDSFQIEALLEWANAFSFGQSILIFVEEADAFLSDNSRGNRIDKFIDVLDGGVRRDIFFVLAATRDLDRQVIDRCEQYQFSLPDAECRREMIMSYFDELSKTFSIATSVSSLLPRLIRRFDTNMKVQGLSTIDNDAFNDEALEDIIALTRGLTRSEIYDVVKIVQGKLHLGSSIWEAIEEAHKIRQSGDSSDILEHPISWTCLHDEVDMHEVMIV